MLNAGKGFQCDDIDTGMTKKKEKLEKGSGSMVQASNLQFFQDGFKGSPQKYSGT